MKIAIGAYYGGYPLKAPIIAQLEAQGHSALDCGAFELNPADDYPDFAYTVALAVQHGDAERGIIICGSGVGASVAANKVDGIRAAVCHDTYSARQGVEHDNLNVLCSGARVVGDEVARESVRAFVGATFSGEERHKRRLDKIKGIEDRKLSSGPYQ